MTKLRNFSLLGLALALTFAAMLIADPTHFETKSLLVSIPAIIVLSVILFKEIK